jgi:hypothetical protein
MDNAAPPRRSGLLDKLFAVDRLKAAVLIVPDKRTR